MIESIDSKYIFAANADNFKTLVLENSVKGPVLVNFWSKKAGPCLRQYPVLDKIIHQYDGRLLLINIDTEVEFNITKEYSITSVPTLKLFRDEKVVETMHGYQSGTDLERTLQKYIARDSDQALADAIAQYSQGNHTQAYKMISDAIISDPENANLPIALVKLLKHEQRFDEAMQFLAALPESIKAVNEITMLQDELSFLTIANTITDVDMLIRQVEAKTDNPFLLQQLSAFYILNKEYLAACHLLVEMMELDKHFDNSYPRTAMLKVFNILGQGHELVTQFRPLLRCYAH